MPCRGGLPWGADKTCFGRPASIVCCKHCSICLSRSIITTGSFSIPTDASCRKPARRRACANCASPVPARRISGAWWGSDAGRWLASTMYLLRINIRVPAETDQSLKPILKLTLHYARPNSQSGTHGDDRSHLTRRRRHLAAQGGAVRQSIAAHSSIALRRRRVGAGRVRQLLCVVGAVADGRAADFICIWRLRLLLDRW